ncbi:MAG: polyphosphate kinase 1 [Pyrinomonadaceae bacterium]|nr:polyphosphate kinase 1 [Pyrinomonadaceae bacterium]
MTQAVKTRAKDSENESSKLSVNDPKFLFNRELSWLEFNKRVLNLAIDENLPLLERLKFLSIFSNNLDEFFMIRVSGLKEQVNEGIFKLSPDGLTAMEQLVRIHELLVPMVSKQTDCLMNSVLPQLKENNIEICAYETLSSAERKRADDYFLKNVFSVLTPQAVDVSHPFPYISNLSLNLGLMVEPRADSNSGKLTHLYTTNRFVRVKLPPNVPRLVPVDEENTRFTPLEELVSANIALLFPNMQTGKAFLFRITRDADVELREDEAGDLLSTMERELHHLRRFSFPVRLEVESSMPKEMVEYIASSIGLAQQDIYAINGYLNIPELMSLYSLVRPALKERPIIHTLPNALRQRENIFDILKKQDVLLHHPYTAYSTVTDFIEAAAEDENVRAIKICLYRTGKNSPIVESLIKASRNGKQVAALVELKARFDEENNIEWARRLEAEGVHVIYGMRGLKTHSKVTLIVRRENEELQNYVHLSTGNYNPVTSKIYTDLGLLTSDEGIGKDVSDLFNFLTGYSFQTKYHELLIAPINLRNKMIKFINRETKNKRNGKDARIIVKINSLTDDKIVRALYRASQAGVEIDLLVRGICVLRPGIKGLSENIRVVSIVGRFLEHSRIFYFANGGKETIYIGSADWMHRNLDRRVEAVVPINDVKLSDYLKRTVLAAYLNDTVNSHLLCPDGSYQKIQAESEPFDSQLFFVGHEF